MDSFFFLQSYKKGRELSIFPYSKTISPKAHKRSAFYIHWSNPKTPSKNFKTPSKSFFICCAMSIALKSTTSFLNLKKQETHLPIRFPSYKSSIVSTRRLAPMATLTTAPTLGLRDTFSNLKKQGKVSTSLSFLLFLIFLSFGSLTFWDFAIVFELLFWDLKDKSVVSFGDERSVHWWDLNL